MEAAGTTPGAASDEGAAFDTDAASDEGAAFDTGAVAAADDEAPPPPAAAGVASAGTAAATTALSTKVTVLLDISGDDNDDDDDDDGASTTKEMFSSFATSVRSAPPSFSFGHAADASADPISTSSSPRLPSASHADTNSCALSSSPTVIDHVMPAPALAFAPS